MAYSVPTAENAAPVNVRSVIDSSPEVLLVGALGPDTPVGRFLAKRGPGLHHVGYRVDDVAATLEKLKAEGVPLIDEAPRPGSRGTTIAFVHPKGMYGVLIELVQEPS